MFRMKELREKNNIKQVDIAKILGVTSQAYGNYEAGRRELSPIQLIKIAEFYETSIDYLLGITNDPRRKPAEVASFEDFSKIIDTLGLEEIVKGLSKEEALKLASQILQEYTKNND